MTGNDIQDHEPGIAADLAELIARRRTLAWLGSAGATLLVSGCGDGAVAAAGPEAGGSGTCHATPTETDGPYPADGTNRAPGPTSNALAVAGILRSDVRASLHGAKAVAPGVPVRLAVRLVAANSGCVPLAGHAVYLWQCDRDGAYSLYDLPEVSYLRGVQITRADGSAAFTTIFPGCYGGRYPHIHFQVFPSAAAASSGRNAILTSQFAMPAEICTTIYAEAPGYAGSVRGFGNGSTARDFVFRDNNPAQMAQQTPSLRGSIGAGFSGSVIVGVNV